MLGRERYEKKHQKHIPDDLIDTDALSELASQFDSSDLEELSENESAEARQARLNAAIAARADKLRRFKPDIVGTIWEIKKKSYRSDEVSNRHNR